MFNAEYSLVHTGNSAVFFVLLHENCILICTSGLLRLVLLLIYQNIMSPAAWNVVFSTTTRARNSFIAPSVAFVESEVETIFFIVRDVDAVIVPP